MVNIRLFTLKSELSNPKMKSFTPQISSDIICHITSLDVICLYGIGFICYRSGTLNSNTVNSKFHLIQNFFEILARIL